jgi:hypothetical protein
MFSQENPIRTTKQTISVEPIVKLGANMDLRNETCDAA